MNLCSRTLYPQGSDKLQEFCTKFEAGIEQWIIRSGTVPLTIAYSEESIFKNDAAGPQSRLLYRLSELCLPLASHLNT